MDERRICLACSDRPGFDSKIAAYAHARETHSALLEDCHVDELFEIHTEDPEWAGADSDRAVGPYHCCAEGCDQTRMQSWTMETHVHEQHGIVNPRRPEHYCTEGDLLRREVEQKQEWDRAGDRFALALVSVDTVGDFLTECRA